MSPTPATLDILVPTRDRPVRLAAMLSSLAAQRFPDDLGPACLYLLDNGVTSAFAEFDVARQLDVFEARGIRTVYLRRPHLDGIHAIRRHLYEASRGTVVLWLDDDVSLPAGTIESLWEGLSKYDFTLAASLVIDLDGLHEEEIGFGHEVRATLHRLAEQIEHENLATVDDAWMEMTSPFGTNLMFRRETFDSTGGWRLLDPYFGSEPDRWGEDVALCVALKSAGEAFVDISRVVLHLTPERRLFSGWKTSEALSELLNRNFGADHPSGLVSTRRPPTAPDRRDAVAARLRAMAARFGDTHREEPRWT